MKRTIVIFLMITSIFFLTFGASGCAREEQPLRLHIRANSNSEEDQNVKLAVRDEVVEYLAPLLKNAGSVKEAKTRIENNSENIASVCSGVLRSKGFHYGAELVIREEYFPSRSYGDLTLESGIYEAVIINLGSGEGDNWWCVAYPPLCFGGEEGEYRSIIKDWIDSRR